MPAIALIAASALAAAQFQPAAVTQDDYPQTALLREKSAAAILNILVGPDGKVVSCTQAGTVGDKGLASQLCGIVKRKQATPGRDAEGNPAFSYRQDFARLFLPGTQQGDKIASMGQSADVELTVQSIPAGASAPIDVNLTLAVDTKGKVSACDYGDSNAAFGKVACQQVEAVGWDKLADANGKAVSYVRPMTVRFSLDTKS